MTFSTKTFQIFAMLIGPCCAMDQCPKEHNARSWEGASEIIKHSANDSIPLKPEQAVKIKMQKQLWAERDIKSKERDFLGKPAPIKRIINHSKAMVVVNDRQKIDTVDDDPDQLGIGNTFCSPTSAPVFCSSIMLSPPKLTRRPSSTSSGSFFDELEKLDEIDIDKIIPSSYTPTKRSLISIPEFDWDEE